VRTIGLLVLSNIFMTYAWYGHLKVKGDAKPLLLIILTSWLIALPGVLLGRAGESPRARRARWVVHRAAAEGLARGHQSSRVPRLLHRRVARVRPRGAISSAWG
jgi:hypothetical protein